MYARLVVHGRGRRQRAASHTACHGSRGCLLDKAGPGPRPRPAVLTERVSGLYHERLDDAVEDVAVVVAVPGVHAEVLHRLRTLVGEQLQVDVAQRGVDHGVLIELGRGCGGDSGRALMKWSDEH